jgi:hypothetical protein
MKTPFPSCVALAFLVPTFLFTVGCSRSDNSKVANALMEAKAAVTDAALDVKSVAVGTWERIRDITYDKRSDFSDDLESAVRSMDDKVSDVKAKLNPDSAERAKAIKEYEEARAELKSRMVELAHASAGAWTDAKAQASRAWEKTVAAYDKATH